MKISRSQFRWVAVCLSVSFFATHGFAAAKEPAVAARETILTACLDAIDYGHPVGEIIGAEKLPYSKLENVPQWATSPDGNRSAWNVPTSSGFLVLTESTRTQGGRDCTLFGKDIDGVAVKSEMASWLTGNGAPFQKVDALKPMSGSDRYIWHKDGKNIEILVSAPTPLPETYSGPAFLISVYATRSGS